MVDCGSKGQTDALNAMPSEPIMSKAADNEILVVNVAVPKSVLPSIKTQDTEIRVNVSLDPRLNLMKQIDDAMFAAAKEVAEKYVHPDLPAHKAAARRAEIMKLLTIIGIQLKPPSDKNIVRWAVTAVYNTKNEEDGRWGDSVDAWSYEDAELQTRFQMACNTSRVEGPAATIDALSNFADNMHSVGIVDLGKEAISYSDFQAKVVAMITAMRDQGVTVDGMDDVADALSQLGHTLSSGSPAP